MAWRLRVISAHMKITVIDFETANRNCASAFSVGIAVIETGEITIRKAARQQQDSLFWHTTCVMTTRCKTDRRSLWQQKRQKDC